MDARCATLTQKLLSFYTPELLRLLRDIVSRRTGLSLRIIDWFVTSYAARHSSSFVLDGARVIVCHEYKAMLKSYSKAHFDPFCRRARLFVDTKRRCAVAGHCCGTRSFSVSFLLAARAGRHALAGARATGPLPHDLWPQ